MALTYLRHPLGPLFHKSDPTIAPLRSAVLFRRDQRLAPLMRSRRRIPLPQIRSSYDSQMFDEGPEGIICYRDETGEIICEGYDEGPRFRSKISLTPPSLRDAEIIDRLQKNWIQIVKGSEVYQGLAPQEEGFNCNGFNNLPFC
ncbi:hypothetical protein SAY87_017073 [Trapa incisa]|uniref:Uncharacterized protein n=1 Tax=Trapa incisa TaxID=236973 RepID=A0AAN7LIZ9_9MYRT|nr:hypothetical protein SAY87_017073 [Trapa incisa]